MQNAQHFPFTVPWCWYVFSFSKKWERSNLTGIKCNPKVKTNLNPKYSNFYNSCLHSKKCNERPGSGQIYIDVQASELSVGTELNTIEIQNIFSNLCACI